mmetsp:Transcript_138466/g.244459  ORF Transcript_138466/g.244459 Transcript_138466/m.244459 type:complete len:168 (+) Transcript_138466:1-504(+)
MRSLYDLKVGDVFEDATVKSYTNFGAFVDIGAEVNALCHINKIPGYLWETMYAGQTLTVTIDKIDLEKYQIGVTATEPGRPLEDLQVGEIVEGTVATLIPCGAFVDFGAMSNGLLHVSEIAAELVSETEDNNLWEGQTVNCIIRNIDLDRQRVDLSTKGVEQHYREY